VGGKLRIFMMGNGKNSSSNSALRNRRLLTNGGKRRKRRSPDPAQGGLAVTRRTRRAKAYLTGLGTQGSRSLQSGKSVGQRI